MKSFLKISVLLVLVGVWVGCEGDYRQKARGSFGEVVVLMDSTQFEGETANAIRETYGGWIQTIPGEPPQFDVRFMDFSSNKQLEQLKRYRNIIVAAPIDDSTNVGGLVRALLNDELERQVKEEESFAFPLRDHWYRDQWVMLLSGPSDSALAEQVKSSEETLTDNLIDKELERWTEEIYDRGEQVALEDSLWDAHGWKIRIQHDWMKNIDTTYTEDNGEEANFLTMRRPLPENDRWFWAWWKDVDNADQVDEDWINAKRDSLMEKWIRGSRDSSYVTTAYNRPHETEEFTYNDDIAFETLGIWTMTNDAMAGPFTNLTVYDDESGRLFMIEFAQFAPKHNKRRFVRQFRAMLRTFESDSTWQQNGSNSE
ncbi:MAG: DUF4837 family protein [Bacteroidota bacterium]